MKNNIRLLLALAFSLGLFVSAQANLKQVTGLSTSAAATIVIPGWACKVILIQNIGANAVNVTIDGGSTYTDPLTQKVGTDPTTGSTGLGIVIPAASNGVPGSLMITTQAGDAGLHRQIRAIMQTGTTTLNISTDDTQSSFPTN